MNNTTSFDEALGSRLKILRISKGLSQKQLADELGVSFQQIQKYEKGINRISCERLCQIAACFSIAAQDLLPPASDASSNHSVARQLFHFSPLTLQMAIRFNDLHDHETKHLLLDLTKRLQSLAP